MKVFLNVYDLHDANSYGYPFGVGVFHSGVEIAGKEYSFGGHEFSYTGVFDIEPTSAYGAKFRESICLGETTLSEKEIERVIEELSNDYPGNGYHPLTKNCNTFANELCLRLVKKGIPGYVNRLANLGSTLSCLIPTSGLLYLGIAPPPTTGSPSDADDSRDLSNMNSPSDRKQPFQPFSGSGTVLTGTSENGATISFSEEGRREKAANAAYKRMTSFSTSVEPLNEFAE